MIVTDRKAKRNMFQMIFTDRSKTRTMFRIFLGIFLGLCFLTLMLYFYAPANKSAAKLYAWLTKSGLHAASGGMTSWYYLRYLYLTARISL
jgi:hypothetical protein